MTKAVIKAKLKRDSWIKLKKIAVNNDMKYCDAFDKIMDLHSAEESICLSHNKKKRSININGIFNY